MALLILGEADTGAGVGAGVGVDNGSGFGVGVGVGVAAGEAIGTLISYATPPIYMHVAGVKLRLQLLASPYSLPV